MVLRIGELLVAQGVLDESQVERVLEIQRGAPEPFGAICERLFGISPRTIEGAWSEQYARLSRVWSRNDLAFDPAVSDLVTARQAWQFRVVPIRFDDGALMLATTKRHLPRALRFATNVIRYPAFFVILERDDLAAELTERYPMRGMDASFVDADRLETTTWLRHHG
jgi:hypothetical protein